jgi:putative membrane protein
VSATVTSAPRRWFQRGAIIAAALVPLVFVGLFIGAVSDSSEATDRIPAALVNQDTIVYQSEDDGTETPVFAGRQLVTELVADGGFAWTITNADEADAALARGEVYAVLTIPHGFSESILSISGERPRQAVLDIRTDDAHSYLTGALSEAVGDSMANAFGTAITEQFISGIYSGLGELGSSLGEAADGAGQLSDGASGLSSGLSDLSSGVAAAQSGAGSYAAGIGRYTAGVDSLSDGLAQFNREAKGLSALSSGVSRYAGGISQLAAALAEANAALAVDPTDPVALGTVNALSIQLTAAASDGGLLASQVSSGIAKVQGGISRTASGAAQLADGSASLRSGAHAIAGGLGELSAGATQSASGAGELAQGAGELASGLQEGAAQVPVGDPASQSATAQVAANPVGITVTRDNEIADAAQGVTAFIVPLGLWLGALAVFLVMRPLPRRMLDSSARTARILRSELGRASLVTVAQAVLLVALLYSVAGISWSLLPATLGFTVLMALVFTALHQLLLSALGRAGLVVSLLAVAVQVTSSGGLYPIQLLAEPYQAISPLLPLTHAVAGMQAMLAGGSSATVVGSVVVLLAFGVASVVLSLAAITRLRRAASLRVAPAS